ncbi:MAG: polymer-forming cytoskeletal protein [Oscillospiraceae bacterium]
MSIKDNMRQAFFELKETASNALPQEPETAPVQENGAIERMEEVSVIAEAAPLTPTPFPGVAVVLSSTVISEDTTLWGNLRSGGNLEIHGSLKGNVEAKGGISVIGGRVQGNLSGASIQLTAASVQGELSATGRVVIDESTMVIGDVQAESARLNGRVRGNLHVTENTTLQANAVLVGDVETRTIAMSEGARVLGTISVDQSNAAATLFEDVDIF